MKRKILSGIAIAGLATCAFGQGVILQNTANSGGSAATSNGLLYKNVGGVVSLFDGYNYNIGATVLGGSSVGSMVAIGTFYPGNNGGNAFTGADLGKFTLGALGATTTISGVGAGGLAFIEIQFWDYNSPLATGTYTSYAAALAGGDYTAQVTFSNATGGPATSPPSTPVALTGMPSVILSQVPEPATFALAGLGIASLLAFRRRK